MKLQAPSWQRRGLGPGKTRTYWGGNIVSCDVARLWQNAATLVRAVRTQETFLKIFRKRIFCVRHKCCVRGRTSQHLRNIITSAMLPPKCVLVLPAPWTGASKTCDGRGGRWDTTPFFLSTSGPRRLQRNFNDNKRKANRETCTAGWSWSRIILGKCSIVALRSGGTNLIERVASFVQIRQRVRQNLQRARQQWSAR